MGWIGLLPTVFESYPAIVIPAGALQELFQGCSRIRRFQKSRIERAKQIHGARDKLKLVASAPQDPLREDVGTELAALLRAARQANGVVVRPPPVKRIGPDHEEDVNLGAYVDILTDMHGLLGALAASGAIDESTEKAARDYFQIQDEGWPAPASVTTASPVFLDRLAVVYLQIIGLFEPVLSTFQHTHVDSSLIEDAATIIRDRAQADNVLAIIDDVRQAVRGSIASGKVSFSPHRKQAADEPLPEMAPAAFNIIADLREADIVVLDDRAFNKQLFVLDQAGHRAKVATSLDLIDDLSARGVISAVQRRAYRHRLRIAGATLVPIDLDEVVSAALRNKDKESAEFRAIRESIGLTRIAQLPRFPAEMRWFASAGIAIRRAIIDVWNRESDVVKAERLADALLELDLRPEDWLDRWEGHPPPGWCEAVNAMAVASLAVPAQLSNAEATRAYNEWFETRVVKPLRTRLPRRYRAVIDQVRTLVFAISEVPDDPDHA